MIKMTREELLAAWDAAVAAWRSDRDAEFQHWGILSVRGFAAPWQVAGGA